MRLACTCIVITILFCISQRSSFSQSNTQTIRLQDGSKFEGIVTAENDSALTLQTTYGVLNILKSNIAKTESIENSQKEIYLSNGTVIKGVIQKSPSESLFVKTDFGTIMIPRSDVKNIGQEPVAQKAIEPVNHASPATLTNTVLHGPVDAGSKIVSGMGSISVTTVEGSDNSLTTVTLAASIINFVTNGFGIGGDCSLSWQSTETASASTVSIGPKMMVAFGRPEATVFPYLALGLNYITGSNSSSGSYYSSSSSSASGSVIKFGAGILSKVGDNLGVPVEFGIMIMNVEGEKATVYSLGVGFCGLFY